MKTVVYKPPIQEFPVVVVSRSVSIMVYTIIHVYRTDKMNTIAKLCVQDFLLCYYWYLHLNTGGCSGIPSTATKCVQLLTGTHSDYDRTLFPNSVGDTTTAQAETRFNGLPSALTTCNANAELFFCAQFFPDCPEKGWTRRPCRALCQAVQTSCQSAYNAAFPANTWPWNCNDFHDTGAANELCLNPEGGNYKPKQCLT